MEHYLDEDQILGSWKSTVHEGPTGRPRWNDRMQITFNYDGTGYLYARTLLRRNASFTWEFDKDCFYYIYDLSGPGSIAVAAVQGNKLGVRDQSGLMMYMKQ